MFSDGLELFTRQWGVDENLVLVEAEFRWWLERPVSRLGLVVPPEDVLQRGVHETLILAVEFGRFSVGSWKVRSPATQLCYADNVLSQPVGPKTNFSESKKEGARKKAVAALLHGFICRILTRDVRTVLEKCVVAESWKEKNKKKSVPTPGIEPGPRRWERRILTTRPYGNPLRKVFWLPLF